MSQSPTPQYLLAWKGATSGPFTLAQIREQLVAGEISRMHHAQVEGRWVSLDELLSAGEASERRAAAAQEARLRQADQGRIEAEQAQQEELAAAERRSQLLPPEARRPPVPPPPPTIRVAPHNFTPPPRADYNPLAASPQRTSGFAITAFVCAIANFVPFLNFVSWVLALVFGHVALNDIGKDPTLGGRGLAIAALIITYFLLILGLTFVVLMAVNGQKVF